MLFNKASKTLRISQSEWLKIGFKSGWDKTSSTKKQDALIQYEIELEFLEGIMDDASLKKTGEDFVNSVTSQFLEYIDSKYLSDDYKIEFVPIKYTDEEWAQEEKTQFIENVSKYVLSIIRKRDLVPVQISEIMKQRFQKLRHSQLKVGKLPEDFFEWAEKAKLSAELDELPPPEVVEDPEEQEKLDVDPERDYAERQKEMLGKRKTFKDVTGKNVLTRQISQEAKILEGICIEESTKSSGILFIRLVGIKLLEYIDSKYKDQEYISQFVPISSQWHEFLLEERKGVMEKVIDPAIKDFENPQVSSGRINEPMESPESPEEVSDEPSSVPEITDFGQVETVNDKIIKNMIDRYKNFRYSQLGEALR